MAARSTGREGTSTPTGRRTQAERSTATRARLLDATVECLIDVGYAATTTTAVAARAGVSRGAQLHHYPTKAALVTAAVEHLAHKTGSELARDLPRLGASSDRVTAVVDLLWARYQSPLFDAWLELAVAARTNQELRMSLAGLQRRVRAAIERFLGELSGSESATGRAHGQLVALTFHLLQGLAVERSVRTESRSARLRRETRSIDAWKAIVADHLHQRG